MIRLPFLIGLFALWVTAGAATQTITVSTNNTPLDRKVLHQVSQEAFRRVGAEFKLVSLPSERSLMAANAGEVDGEGLRVDGLTEQYPNLLRVPERYVSISFVAFARDATISLDRGWDSLKPYRVGFIRGWKLFEAHAAGARIVQRVETPEQLLQMLDQGRIDIALYTRSSGMALAHRMGLPAIAPLAPTLRDADMYLYLNKRHEALVPRLAKALREMKADGTYNRIIAGLGD
jgi:polar amino acid transport system substrate-binding protein